MVTCSVGAPGGPPYCRVSGAKPPNSLQRGLPSPRGSVTPRSPPGLRDGLRNIDRTPIALPLRDRLRTRLTLGRRTWPRKPWVFGVGPTRPHCRYSCLHFLFRPLQRRSRDAFGAGRNAPLPPDPSRGPAHGFGGSLNARSSSTHPRSTSELLRTL